MGLFANQYDHARDCHGQGRQPDFRKTPSRLCNGGPKRWISGGLIAAIAFFSAGIAACADTLRVATLNTELSAKGPGLLFRDVLKGTDPQVLAVLTTLNKANADIIALQGIDYDHDHLALKALAEALRTAYALEYPYLFAAPPNAGLMTDLDLDGEGKAGGPGDAHGYGQFYGQGSMALLSRYPIRTQDVLDFSDLLWRDLPDALLPVTGAGPFPSAQAQDIQRLHSHGAWAIPIDHPTFGPTTVLTFHAGPPVFDGPEDRNGRRNHDEIRFWSLYLEGIFGPAPQTGFVWMGDANVDPERGDGIGSAIAAFLKDPRIQDPLPNQPTVNWPQTGPMRVDYILPSADWTVTKTEWFAPDHPDIRHHLVLVELTR